MNKQKSFLISPEFLRWEIDEATTSIKCSMRWARQASNICALKLRLDFNGTPKNSLEIGLFSKQSSTAHSLPNEESIFGMDLIS